MNNANTALHPLASHVAVSGDWIHTFPTRNTAPFMVVIYKNNRMYDVLESSDIDALIDTAASFGFIITAADFDAAYDRALANIDTFTKITANAHSVDCD